MYPVRRRRRAVLALALALALAVALALASVADLRAQPVTRRAEVGLAVGAATPIGDLAGFTGPGHGVDLLLHLPGARRRPGVRVELGYASMSGDRLVTAGRTARGPDTRVISGALSAVLAPASARVRVLQPYLLGGVGLYNFDYGDADDGDPVAELANATEAGFNAGAGIRFPIGPLHAFLEARVHNVFSADQPTRYFLPIKAGLAF